MTVVFSHQIYAQLERRFVTLAKQDPTTVKQTKKGFRVRQEIGQGNQLRIEQIFPQNTRGWDNFLLSTIGENTHWEQKPSYQIVHTTPQRTSSFTIQPEDRGLKGDSFHLNAKSSVIPSVPDNLNEFPKLQQWLHCGHKRGYKTSFRRASHGETIIHQDRSYVNPKTGVKTDWSRYLLSSNGTERYPDGSTTLSFRRTTYTPIAGSKFPIKREIERTIILPIHGEKVIRTQKHFEY
jgi:hypothetical protein